MSDNQVEVTSVTKEERLAVLKEIGQQRRINEGSIVAAVGLQDRKEAMIALKGLGFALIDIGNFYDGKTRERVRQLVGRSERAKPVVRETATEEQLAREIWCEASKDMTWWGTNGRLDNNRIVALYLSHQYTWDRARELSRSRDSIKGKTFYTGCSKVDIILRVTFGVEPTHDAKVKWFTDQIEDHTKKEILKTLNEGQELKIPEYTFLRIWRELGLNVRIRSVKALPD